jgi:hypothetical protein
MSRHGHTQWPVSELGPGCRARSQAQGSVRGSEVDRDDRRRIDGSRRLSRLPGPLELREGKYTSSLIKSRRGAIVHRSESRGPLRYARRLQHVVPVLAPLRCKAAVWCKEIVRTWVVPHPTCRSVGHSLSRSRLQN